MEETLNVKKPGTTGEETPPKISDSIVEGSRSSFRIFAKKSILLAEVGDGVFKYVALVRKSRSTRISSWGSISYLELSVDPDDTQELFNAGLSMVKRRLVKDFDEIYIVSSELDFFVRRLELPLLKERELQHAVSWEVDKLIPIPVDDSYLLIKKDRSQEAKLVLTAGAVPRQQIDRWEHLGECLKGVVPSSVALAASGPYAESPSTAFCYIYVDDERMNIGFYNSDGLLYSHPIQLSANRLFDTGETGMPVRRVVDELINGIEVFYSYFPEITVKALALLSDPRQTESISEAISERLDMPIVIPETWRDYTSQGGRDATESIDIQYLPLLGALRIGDCDFKFLPQSLVAGRRFKRAKKIGFYGFSIFALISALLGTYWLYDVGRLRAEQKNIETIRTEMTQSKAYRQISSYRSAAAFLVSLKKEFDSRSEDYSNLLKILSTITPDGIYLENVAAVRKDNKLNVRVAGYYDGNLSKTDIALVEFMESLGARAVGNLRLQRLGQRLSGNRKIESFQIDGIWNPYE